MVLLSDNKTKQPEFTVEFLQDISSDFSLQTYSTVYLHYQQRFPTDDYDSTDYQLDFLLIERLPDIEFLLSMCSPQLDHNLNIP